MLALKTLRSPFVCIRSDSFLVPFIVSSLYVISIRLHLCFILFPFHTGKYQSGAIQICQKGRHHTAVYSRWLNYSSTTSVCSCWGPDTDRVIAYPCRRHLHEIALCLSTEIPNIVQWCLELPSVCCVWDERTHK